MVRVGFQLPLELTTRLRVPQLVTSNVIQTILGIEVVVSLHIQQVLIGNIHGHIVVVSDEYEKIFGAPYEHGLLHDFEL